MNPSTNQFEKLTEAEFEKVVPVGVVTTPLLLRPNGEPIPPHWSIFQVGELVSIKNTTFKVAHIGEAYLILEPASTQVIEDSKLGYYSQDKD